VDQYLKADPDQHCTALKPLSDPGPFPVGTLPLRPVVAEEEEAEALSTMCMHTLYSEEEEEEEKIIR
jgi:hypothetical protein